MNNLAVKDLLYLVNEKDSVLGYEDKEKCHDGDGLLHRAFSIFIFNDKKQLLLQKRSTHKRLWPLYWSNSVCSHPRKGESYERATQRRLKEELGIETELTYIFKFEYKAKYKEFGSENELCSVFIGKSKDNVRANPAEISEFKYMEIKDLDRDIGIHPELYTPWFKLEWEKIKSDYRSELAKLLIQKNNS